jgi:hypothetical protein
VPWNVYGATNNDVLNDQDASKTLFGAVISRIRLLSSTELKTLREMTPEMLVDGGYCDPIRLFVKNEPHSSKKRRERKFRLIMSVSLCDQLVERVLNQHLNKAEIALWADLPVCPGQSLAGEGVETLVSKLRKVQNPHSTDVSGWDWSVSESELLVDAHRRGLLLKASVSHTRAMIGRAAVLSRSVLVLSNGAMFSQTTPGIQKSGSYNTSSTNSWIRVYASWLSGADQVVAMGDDCVDSGVDQGKMVQLGHPLKSVRAEPEDFEELLYAVPQGPRPGLDVADHLRVPTRGLSTDEPFADFCSHVFCESGAVVYSGWGKSLYRLMHITEDKLAAFLQFAALMRDNPAWPEVLLWLVNSQWFNKDPTGELRRYIEEVSSEGSPSPSWYVAPMETVETSLG